MKAGGWGFTKSPSWENLKQWAPVGGWIVELTFEPSNSVMVW